VATKPKLSAASCGTVKGWKSISPMRKSWLEEISTVRSRSASALFFGSSFVRAFSRM
jgi:hypothetical protein